VSQHGSVLVPVAVTPPSLTAVTEVEYVVLVILDVETEPEEGMKSETILLLDETPTEAVLVVAK
jgi:hypothetical protein